MTDPPRVPAGPTIFVSYARTDSEAALKLSHDLKAAGAQIWLDQLDIPPGERWDRAVEAALEHSKCMLVILSPRSVSSENVMDEVSYAIDEKKEIVPVIVEHCKLPLRMRRFQFIDFTADYGASLKQLLSVLQIAREPQQQVGSKGTATIPAEMSRGALPQSSKAPPSSLSTAAKSFVSERLSTIIKKTISYKDHVIEVRHIGTITIYYDGKEVITKKLKTSVFSASVGHMFQIAEDGKQVVYEVTWGSRWHGMEYWHEVRRDGDVIFSDR